MIEHILHHEQCDVDLIDALERATPLHFAVNLEDPEFREYFVGQLLDAGADYRCVHFLDHISIVATNQICDSGAG